MIVGIPFFIAQPVQRQASPAQKIERIQKSKPQSVRHIRAHIEQQHRFVHERRQERQRARHEHKFRKGRFKPLTNKPNERQAHENRIGENIRPFRIERIEQYI